MFSFLVTLPSVPVSSLVKSLTLSLVCFLLFLTSKFLLMSTWYKEWLTIIVFPFFSFSFIVFISNSAYDVIYAYNLLFLLKISMLMYDSLWCASIPVNERFNWELLCLYEWVWIFVLFLSDKYTDVCIFVWMLVALIVQTESMLII